MGIAKKGSRTIVVDDASYRWVISPDDGYMVLVIEHSVDPGQRLEAYFKYHDVFDPEKRWGIVGQRRSITPNIVRIVILEALRRGWRPSQGDLPPLKMHDAEQLVPLAEESAEPCTDH